MVYCSAKLFAMLQLATSSEILFVFGYFALIGSLACIAVTVVLVDGVLEHIAVPLKRSLPSAAIAVSSIFGTLAAGYYFAAPVLRVLTRWLVDHPLVLPWLAALAGIGVLWRIRGDSEHARSHSPWYTATLALALIVGVAAGFRGVPGALSGSQREALYRVLQNAVAKPSVLNWQAYFPVLQASTNPTIDLPAPVIEDLRRLLPPLQVIIADPAHSVALPVMLNQHIVNPGHVISTSLRYFDRYAHQRPDGTRDHPIFNNGDVLTSDEWEFLDEYRVDYVLVDPTFRGSVRRKLAAAESAFEQLYDREGFTLYRYRGRSSSLRREAQ